MATTADLIGLFGQDPQALQQARDMQMAQLDPAQRLYMMGAQTGRSIGQGLGALFGVDVQDPMVKKATQLRALANEFDTTTAEGMMKFAQAAQQIDPRAGALAAQQAQSMMKTQSEIGKNVAAETKTLMGIQREEQLRKALSSLPPEATDKDIESVVRQYGDPDKIFSVLERRQKAEADRAAKAELEREKMAQREQELSFRRELAAGNAALRSAVTDTQRQIAQARLDEIKAKQEEKADKKAAAQEMAVNHASKVVTDVQEASNLVGGMTTGLIGKGQSFVPGTDAYNLNQRLLTIKANLGFDRLQQMRDASPTGGALGQVAVQELNALQSTVGSLEIGQDRKELEKNLSKIEHHYTNWIRTTQGEKPISFDEFMKAKKPAQAAPAAGGWSIRPR